MQNGSQNTKNNKNKTKKEKHQHHAYNSILHKLNVSHDKLDIWLILLKVKIYFVIFIYLFTCFVCVVLCVCSHAIVYMYRSHDKLCELVLFCLPCGFQRSNSSCQVWWQVSLLTESSHWPLWLLLIIDDGALRLQLSGKAMLTTPEALTSLPTSQQRELTYH